MTSDFRSGLYRHWKGNMYLAVGLVQDSTNRVLDRSAQEPMVLYISLDVGPHLGQRHVRSLDQWFEKVKWPGSDVKRPRFEWVGP